MGWCKPNILFVLTDQQSLRAMSAYGNRHLHTPHMDSLAAHGVRFEKSYCTAPVCSPARSSLVTGRMPHETGVNVNDQAIIPSIPSMGEVFREAGYETAWAGKWHVPHSYPQTANAGIDGFDLLELRGVTSFRLGADTDEPAADEAVRFLREKHDQPFLLAVSVHNPHDICWWVRQEPIQQPDADSFPPLPDNFAIDPDEPEFITQCRRRDHYGPEIRYTENWTQDQWRAYLNAYYRLTEQADRAIGRVLEALREQGLEDDTLVVFTSDHGEGMAAHQWIVKLMLYEEPVTVPLVVSWKGVTPAGTVDADHLVSGLDLLPTLCDYAGIQPPPGVLGMSLKPLIEDPTLPGRDFLVAELQPDPDDMRLKGRMVRTPRYKYVAFSHGRNPEMLFDLQTDPGETRNLARDPATAGELEAHRRLLAEWMQRTDDEFSTGDGTT